MESETFKNENKKKFVQIYIIYVCIVYTYTHILTASFCELETRKKFIISLYGDYVYQM